MRLASGIAPIMDYRRAGVKVGLGVDGSASNDGNHMLLEARQAMLLARLKLAEDERQAHASGAAFSGGVQMTAREALVLATLGGAAVLGRKDIGAIAPGMCADFVAYKLDRLAFAGARSDPLAALLFCAPQQPDVVVVNGRVLVQDGQLATVDLPPLIERHNRISREMING
jgi:cytosine/adenosine deaminase-related metal-dependent hydrolase